MKKNLYNSDVLARSLCAGVAAYFVKYMVDPLMSRDKASLWVIGFRLAARLILWLVAPLAAAWYLGRFLDAKFQTKPWLFFASLMVSFIVSNVGLVRESLRAMKTINESEGFTDEKSRKKT